MTQNIFEEGEYCLRRMEDTPEDYALLARWLTDPRVLEYYEGRDNPFPLEKVKEKYAPRVLAAESVIPCIMEYECKPAGYLQFYPADSAEYQFDGHGNVYALDLFIGEPDLWGRGLGTQFVRLLLCYLFEQKDADWVILDPHGNNARAIRAYEKCGFRKLKVLPQHELHEGKWVDCWLMGIRWDQNQE
ncbi:MAG: N-acetyltransferase [Chloroflexi bacterium]|nr:MAG: N-acetyltransferase [Chloroflexota bacterium]